MADQTRPVSPDTPLTANEAAALDELDQQRTRAEVAEQERDEALDDLAKARGQLADAYAAGARSATEADQLREQLGAAAGALRGITELRDEALSREANLRTQLNSADTERARLTADLATTIAAATGTAEFDEALDDRDQAREQRDSYKREVKALRDLLTAAQAQRDERLTLQESSNLAKQIDNVREQLDRANTGCQTLQEHLTAQDQMLSDVVVTLQDWLHDTTADGTPIESLLNRLRHGFQQHAAESPVPSRRAQELAQGYAEAVARLRDDERYTNWWMSGGAEPTGLVRQHLADYLETVGPDGVDVETGRWPAREQAVVRAAINWRVSGVGVPDHALDDQERALIEAVDALPHIGEIRDEHSSETPAPKLAQGRTVSPGTVSSVIASSNRFSRAAAGLPAARDWVIFRTGSGRQYEGERSEACPGDGQPGHWHDIWCVRLDPATREPAVTDDDRLRAIAHTRPGMCTYPAMLRQPAPPAVRPAARPRPPVPDIDLPAVTRWRWWHRWTRR